MGLKTTLAMLAVAVGVAGPAHAGVSTGHSGWRWSNPLPQGQAIRALQLEGSLGYAAGDFGTVLRTEDAGATWSGLASGVTVDLDHVAIIDENSVVVAGRCSVRRSDDSGITFARLPWTPSDEHCAAPIAGIAFPSELRGYVVLEDGQVFQTKDGGLTWLRTTDPPTSRRRQPTWRSPRRRSVWSRLPPAPSTAPATAAFPGRSLTWRRTGFAAFS
jgi:photosystem II stability/assembly factor-like uncharacterized protein